MHICLHMLLSFITTYIYIILSYVKKCYCIQSVLIACHAHANQQKIKWFNFMGMQCCRFHNSSKNQARAVRAPAAIKGPFPPAWQEWPGIHVCILRRYVYMCICVMCASMYICVYMCIYVHVCIYIYVCMYVYIWLYMCIYAYVYVYISVYLSI